MPNLDEILDDLYGEKKEPAEPAAEPAPAEPAGNEPAKTEPKETEMTDEELALSVNVELPADPAPAPTQQEKKPRTEEETKRIREEAEADIKALREEFPELGNLRGLGELPNPQQFLAYRKKGLTAVEAYTLTAVQTRKQQPAGTKKPPLRSAPAGGGDNGNVTLTAKEIREASTETGLSADDIKKYYRKF